MSDIILSDVRVPISKTPILGATIQSGRIERKPGAHRLIVEFLPRWMLTTKVHSLTKAPTTAPPAGGTYFTPHVHVQRNVSAAIGVNGSRRFASAPQVILEDLTVGYQDPAHLSPADFTGPDAVVHEQSFLPPMTMAEGVDGPRAIQGFVVGFNLGDGSGVVEALTHGDIRVSISTAIAVAAQTTGTLTMFDDSFDGEYRVTAWGLPS